MFQTTNQMCYKDEPYRKNDHLPPCVSPPMLNMLNSVQLKKLQNGFAPGLQTMAPTKGVMRWLTVSVCQ